MNLLVVCHFGLLNRHFASISGHIFLIQNLMYSMFYSHASYVFPHFCSLIIYTWIQKNGLTSLNDRITCNFRIINQFT